MPTPKTTCAFNGKSSKTVLTGDGPIRLDTPRDRDGSFSPILILRHERRFTGFDENWGSLRLQIGPCPLQN